MQAATERLVVLMTPNDKSRIEKAAKKAGLSTAEFVRRAVTAYHPDDQPEIDKIRALTDQLRLSADAAEEAIDQALASYGALRKQLDARKAGWALLGAISTTR